MWTRRPIVSRAVWTSPISSLESGWAVIRASWCLSNNVGISAHRVSHTVGPAISPSWQNSEKRPALSPEGPTTAAPTALPHAPLLQLSEIFEHLSLSSEAKKRITHVYFRNPDVTRCLKQICWARWLHLNNQSLMYSNSPITGYDTCSASKIMCRSLPQCISRLATQRGPHQRQRPLGRAPLATADKDADLRRASQWNSEQW
jgi:hypothetical protein